jgi:hypothetical protein
VRHGLVCFLHFDRHVGLRLQLWPAQLRIAAAQAHELNFRLREVSEHERRLRFVGADHLQRLALAAAVGVRLLERFRLQGAGAAEARGRLPGHHVGVGADGDDAGVAGAAGENDGRNEEKTFQSRLSNKENLIDKK